MSKKNVKSAVIAGLALAALAGAVYYCWTIRELPKARREACKQAARELRNCKPNEIVPYLRKLSTETFFTSRFNDKFPWMHLSFDTKVPIDFIGQLTEDSLYRLAGRGTAETTDAPKMKDILAFTYEIFPKCSKAAQTSLRERQIDACFFLNDFDGAIKIIEPGIPGHSAAWSKGTVAKLRAHKAMLANDHKEVVKQLMIFDEYLHSDEMQGRDDEYDQTTGVMYSPEWVMGRNYLRCAIHSCKAGDIDAAKKFIGQADPLLAKAFEKTKDDKTSRQELLKEYADFTKNFNEFKISLAPLAQKKKPQ